MEINKSTQNDFSDIQSLFIEMFKLFPEDQNINFPNTAEGIQYLKNRIENGIAYTAKYGSKIIGFIIGSINIALPFKTYEKNAYIENLFVHSEYRRKKIGSLLIKSFIEHCKNEGIKIIQTDSDYSEILKRFYLESGFKVTGLEYQIKI